VAQIGSQPGSWSSFQFTGLNTLNQVGMGTFAMPEAGRINQLNCYFAGHTGAVTARLVLWDSSGNIVAQSGSFSAAKGSGATGGQSWQTQVIPDVLAASGAAFSIGFWRDPSKDAEWSIASGGTWLDNTNTSGSPGAFTGLTSNSGSVGAYAAYVPLRCYVRRSGAWVAAWPAVRRSGAWTQPPVYVRRSGAWLQVS
jgi:hypothetical protein